MLQPVDSGIKGEFGGGRNQTGFGSCVIGLCWGIGAVGPQGAFGVVFLSSLCPLARVLGNNPGPGVAGC